MYFSSIWPVLKSVLKTGHLLLLYHGTLKVLSWNMVFYSWKMKKKPITHIILFIGPHSSCNRKFQIIIDCLQIPLVVNFSNFWTTWILFTWTKLSITKNEPVFIFMRLTSTLSPLTFCIWPWRYLSTAFLVFSS